MLNKLGFCRAEPVYSRELNAKLYVTLIYLPDNYPCYD